MPTVKGFAIVLLLALLGACRQPAGNPSSGSPSASPVSGPEDSIRRGLAFLAEQQSEDGAWRSKVVEPFKDGPSLTPVVLKVFVYTPDTLIGEQGDQIREAGESYLAGLDEKALSELAFPVYSVSLGAAVLPEGEQRKRWLAFLRGHQLTEELGWSPDDIEYGGWGESIKPYRKPADKKPEERANYASPNISNTLFALAALRLSGIAADDPAVQKALKFVERCQNHPGDGGFFFSPVNLTQNKAKDRNSYGSTTADGLRALSLCGVAADEPRRQAAVKWLAENFEAEQVPGLKPDSPIYFYYCWSLAHSWRYFEKPDSTQVRELEQQLVKLQRADGSWSNSNPQMTENDPLVATSMAVSALVLAQNFR